MSSEDLELKFEAATKVLPSITTSLSPEQLLLFYALFKQAKQGDCAIPRPGFLQFEARRKWDSWTSLAGLCKADAMQQYIEGITKFVPNWEGETFEGIEASWVRVSRMAPPKPETIGEDEKSKFFHAIKNQDFECLKKIPLDGIVDAKDSEGMTGLHWAADGGSTDIIELLLTAGAELDARDASGLTALYYAAFCSHRSAVEMLIGRGADQTVRDEEGLTPKQVTDEECKPCFL